MTPIVEKAAALSGARVPLGYAATPAPTPAASARPAAAGFDWQARCAELEQRLAERERHIVELQQQRNELEQALAAAGDSEAEQNAALAAMAASIDEARATAAAQGRAEAIATAETAAAAERETMAAQWRTALAELATQLRDYRAHWQRGIADLTFAAIAKLLGDNLADAAQVNAAVAHLIRESGLGGQPLRVLLAPAHYAALKRAGFGENRELELRPDPRVGHGGCLLETDTVVVDGRYETQLRRLAALVHDDLVTQQFVHEEWVHEAVGGEALVHHESIHDESVLGDSITDERINNPLTGSEPGASA